MESLPPEMVVAIFRLLSLPDCCRLCAISRHFSSLLPLAVSLFRIRRLVVREPDFVDVDFLRRCGLADAVGEVVVILDGFGQPTIDYLQSLFRVCTRVKSLSFKCASNSKVKSKITPIFPLNILFLGIETKTVKRFDYNDENVDWADMVVTAGGDGTFLMGSSKILDRNKPIIGINTDPTK